MEKQITEAISANKTDLGIRLNGKLVFYLGELANPKNGLNLIPDFY